MTDSSDGNRGARSAITTLVGLSDSQRETLLDVLGDGAMYSSRTRMKSELADSLKSVDSDLLGDLVDLAMAYVEVALDRDVDIDKGYVDSIINAVPLDDSAEDPERIAAFLSELLHAPAIQFAAGAALATRSHAALLLRSAIITDARPVFSRGDAEAPAGYVLWHTLRLTNTRDVYSSDEEVVEITMDHRDLTALAAQAQSALKKRLTLQEALEPSGAIWDAYRAKGDDGN